tara:strand:- start:779 stop:1030 length:252 start_codon:yes stop_codon:yes gene_type:complete
MFIESNLYYGTHYHWDDQDREYTLCATWKLLGEENSWDLVDLEIEDQEPGAPDLVLETVKDSNLWREVESSGPPSNLEEVDYA